MVALTAGSSSNNNKPLEATSDDAEQPNVEVIKVARSNSSNNNNHNQEKREESSYNTTSFMPSNRRAEVPVFHSGSFPPYHGRSKILNWIPGGDDDEGSSEDGSYDESEASEQDAEEASSTDLMAKDWKQRFGIESKSSSEKQQKQKQKQEEQEEQEEQQEQQEQEEQQEQQETESRELEEESTRETESTASERHSSREQQEVPQHHETPRPELFLDNVLEMIKEEDDEDEESADGEEANKDSPVMAKYADSSTTVNLDKSSSSVFSPKIPDIESDDKTRSTSILDSDESGKDCQEEETTKDTKEESTELSSSSGDSTTKKEGGMFRNMLSSFKKMIKGVGTGDKRVAKGASEDSQPLALQGSMNDVQDDDDGNGILTPFTCAKTSDMVGTSLVDTVLTSWKQIETVSSSTMSSLTLENAEQRASAGVDMAEALVPQQTGKCHNTMCVEPSCESEMTRTMDLPDATTAILESGMDMAGQTYQATKSYIETTLSCMEQNQVIPLDQPEQEQQDPMPFSTPIDKKSIQSALLRMQETPADEAVEVEVSSGDESDEAPETRIAVLFEHAIQNVVILDTAPHAENSSRHHHSHHHNSSKKGKSSAGPDVGVIKTEEQALPAQEASTTTKKASSSSKGFRGAFRRKIHAASSSNNHKTTKERTGSESTANKGKTKLAGLKKRFKGTMGGGKREKLGPIVLEESPESTGGAKEDLKATTPESTTTPVAEAVPSNTDGAMGDQKEQSNQESDAAADSNEKDNDTAAVPEPIKAESVDNNTSESQADEPVLLATEQSPPVAAQ